MIIEQEHGVSSTGQYVRIEKASVRMQKEVIKCRMCADRCEQKALRSYKLMLMLLVPGARKEWRKCHRKETRTRSE